MKASCSFCSIIQSGETARVIAENHLAIALMDGFPLTKGHALIIIKRHVSSFFDTTELERGHLIELIEIAKAYIDAKFSPNAYNIGINDGAEAGQTVNHLHIHLIPRYKGDVPDPRGGVRWVIPEKADYWSSSK